MIKVELKEHQNWQLNKMKINLVRNLLQKKVKMDRRDSARMNIWFILGSFENNLFVHLLADWLNTSL